MSQLLRTKFHVDETSHFADDDDNEKHNATVVLWSNFCYCNNCIESVLLCPVLCCSIYEHIHTAISSSFQCQIPIPSIDDGNFQQRIGRFFCGNSRDTTNTDSNHNDGDRSGNSGCHRRANCNDHNNDNDDTSMYLQRLYSSWWWCTFRETIARDCRREQSVDECRTVPVFRRMWVWTKRHEDCPAKRRRERRNKDTRQSCQEHRNNSSSVGNITTTINDINNNTHRIGIVQTSLDIWRLLKALRFLLFISLVGMKNVEGFVLERRIYTCWSMNCLNYRTIPNHNVARIPHGRSRDIVLFATNDNDDEYVDDDDDDDIDVLGEGTYDTADGTLLLGDLSWRVEKLRLEEQNTQRFLKARPRFLPYTECRKWVQAFSRWTTQEDWNEWIAMGEKRNAYIPSRPDEYYGRLGQWVSWDHFLIGTNSRQNDTITWQQPRKNLVDYDSENEFR